MVTLGVNPIGVRLGMTLKECNVTETIITGYASQHMIFYGPTGLRMQKPAMYDAAKKELYYITADGDLTNRGKWEYTIRFTKNSITMEVGTRVLFYIA